jgi:hypothetical protein
VLYTEMEDLCLQTTVKFCQTTRRHNPENSMSTLLVTIDIHPKFSAFPCLQFFHWIWWTYLHSLGFLFCLFNFSFQTKFTYITIRQTFYLDRHYFFFF